MKKKFVFLLSLINLFLISVTFTGCKDEHIHTFGDWQFESEATCLNAEQYYRICECGEKETKQIGDALPHIESDWIMDQDSTCAKSGIKHKECLVCETVIETGTIVKKEHNMTEWAELTPENCENAQVLERHCLTCETQNETKEGIIAFGHTESEWKTCLDLEQNETGYQEKTCLTCEKRIDYAPKIYTITFESNGGTSVSSISQNFDEVISKPTDPTKENYLFKGWYLDDGTFENEFFTLANGESAKMPIGGACLYAKWEEINYTFDYHKITYRYLGNDEYEIVRGQLYDPNVYSDEIKYNVVSIADNAFYNWQEGTSYANKTSFVSYTLPKTVKRIGKNAFRNSLLKNIYFETGSVLESIGDYSFSENIMTTYFLKLPETVKTIGNYAFSSDNSDGNYMQYVYIPSKVENFGENVFVGQKRLVRIVCTSEKIRNNQNYIDLISKISTLDSSVGEFTWVEDMLFFKSKSENFARLVHYNTSGLYTKDINETVVKGKYEIIKMPKFKYDYVIESFTFFDIEKIHAILFSSEANVIGIDSYAFGQFKNSAGTFFSIGDILLGNTTNYPNFLFSSDIDWKNMVLGQEWLYLNSSNARYCCVEIDGRSETKTNELLNRLNESLNIIKDTNYYYYKSKVLYL